MQRLASLAHQLAPRLVEFVLDRFPAVDRTGFQTFAANDAGLAEGLREEGRSEHGTPVTHTLDRMTSLDSRIASGLWQSTAGRHVLKFDFDEWVHILEGEAHVTALGETRTLRAGDVAFFRAGLDMTWEVPRYVRKVWVHRYRRPGVLRRVRNHLARLRGRG